MYCSCVLQYDDTFRIESTTISMLLHSSKRRCTRHTSCTQDFGHILYDRMRYINFKKRAYDKPMFKNKWVWKRNKKWKSCFIHLYWHFAPISASEHFLRKTALHMHTHTHIHKKKLLNQSTYLNEVQGNSHRIFNIISICTIYIITRLLSLTAKYNQPLLAPCL